MDLGLNPAPRTDHEDEPPLDLGGLEELMTSTHVPHSLTRQDGAIQSSGKPVSGNVPTHSPRRGFNSPLVDDGRRTKLASLYLNRLRLDVDSPLAESAAATGLDALKSVSEHRHALARSDSRELDRCSRLVRVETFSVLLSCFHLAQLLHPMLTKSARDLGEHFGDRLMDHGDSREARGRPWRRARTASECDVDQQ